MRTIAIAGASGVVGRHLVAAARAAGLSVRVLSRGVGAEGLSAHRWDPNAAAAGDAGAVEAVRVALDGADAVVNLAGASLAEGRLNTAHKRRILASRLTATGALAAGHAACAAPPPVWLNASAVGFYGDTGEALVGEDAPRGAGFLAAVCERWEDAARAVEERARVVLARIGLVLARDAPAWQAMLRPILLGLGGRLGPGTQWYAWIDADDLARALLFLLERDDARGAFNLTTPDPVRQQDLAWETALLANRPALFPAPAPLLRLAVGEVADALLLPSCRALPTRLEALGFRWARGDVGQELLWLLELDPARRA